MFKIYIRMRTDGVWGVLDKLTNVHMCIILVASIVKHRYDNLSDKFTSVISG